MGFQEEPLDQREDQLCSFVRQSAERQRIGQLRLDNGLHAVYDRRQASGFIAAGGAIGRQQAHRVRASARFPWTKEFLFITDGNTTNEQYSFDYYSDQLISSWITPSPIGGTVSRVYKKSADIIDGEEKPFMQGLVANGLVFINFIGHSGGRIGAPISEVRTEFQNTNGMLPFVASVSCNVGDFTNPASDVLSEDFVLADNRGASAAGQRRAWVMRPSADCSSINFSISRSTRTRGISV